MIRICCKTGAHTSKAVQNLCKLEQNRANPTGRRPSGWGVAAEAWRPREADVGRPRAARAENLGVLRSLIRLLPEESLDLVLLY